MGDKTIHWIKLPLMNLAGFLSDWMNIKGFKILSISLYGLFSNKVLVVYETSEEDMEQWHL